MFKKDKIKHALLGFAIAFLIHTITNNLSVAVMGTIFIGGGKEVLDSKIPDYHYIRTIIFGRIFFSEKRTRANGGDIAATALGAVLYAVLYI